MSSPLEQAQALLAARRPADATALLEPFAATSDDPELHHLLGNALVALGRADDAERCYRRAVALDPRLRKSWNNLGNLAGARGDLDEALACYGRAIALEPSAPAHFNRGRLLTRLLRHDEALADFEAGARLDPGHAKLRAELGVALAREHRWRDALPHLREALARGEATTVARTKLIDALHFAGRSEEAIATAEAWCFEQPQEARAHRSLGAVLVTTDRPRAIRELEQATRIDPSDAGAWAALASAFAGGGQMHEAEAAFERSLALRKNWSIQADLGTLRGDLRRAEAALALYDEILAANVSIAADVHSSRLLELCYATRSAQSVFEEHVAWGRRWSTPSVQARGPLKTHARLRLGYLTPDWRFHAVAHFLEPVLRSHDRRQFELFAYADNDLDAVSGRLTGLVDRVRHVQGMTDDELARILLADELDVLIELAGHTGVNRQRLLATRRFATLTATYLGYPNTTGNPGVDVRIGDALVDGPEHAPLSLCTEELWCLSSPGWRYLAPADSPALPMEPNHRPTTFGSFNNFRKLSPAVVALWARVLAAAPDSRLLVKAKPLADRAVADRFRDEFVALGVEPDRLDLRGWSASGHDHLATYNEVDVALDSFPYHGTTTTCEALWMGVPVVSLVGDAHVSRVGLALLTAVGQPDWCASSQDEYVARAVALARHRPERRAVRAAMQASPLLDPVPLVRELEGRIVAWLAARGRTIDTPGPQPAPHSR
jgi:protein O-GlcNAc transferase